jgi:protein ImuB
MPADLSDDGRQLALDEDALSAAEAQRAFAQTQAVVGNDEVLQAIPQGGRDPSEQALWYRWGEQPPAPERDPQAPWPGRIPTPSPALVPSEPYPLEVEWDEGIPTRVRLGSRWVEVISWAGPWRKVGRWWDGEHPSDRYQIVTSAGAFLCAVVEGKTYMAGVYD